MMQKMETDHDAFTIVVPLGGGGVQIPSTYLKNALLIRMLLSRARLPKLEDSSIRRIELVLVTC